MSSFLVQDIEAAGPYKACISQDVNGDTILVVTDLNAQVDYIFDYITWHGSLATGPLSIIKEAQNCTLLYGHYKQVWQQSLTKAVLIKCSDVDRLVTIAPAISVLTYSQPIKVIQQINGLNSNKCTCGNLNHGLCSDWCDLVC